VDADTPRLNTEQRLVFDTLTRAVERNEGGAFFVDGPGGTGKTFLQNTTLAQLRVDGRIALATASSGIAATLLTGGTTAHSRFKIPIDIDATSTCTIAKNSHLAALLRETALIFWDEAVMMHRHCMEAVDRTLRDIRDSDTRFGGIVICFCGDFRQTLPIVRRGTRGQIVSATLKRSPLWPGIHVLKLTQNMRLRRAGLTDAERVETSAFAQRLLHIGERADGDGRSAWDKGHICLWNTRQSLAQTVFPDLHRRAPVPEDFRDRMLLAPKNDAVNALNTELLDITRGDASDCFSADYCKNPEDAAEYPIEFLHSISIAALPPHHLRLKIGCPVILLRNLDPTRALCNGTRLIVTHVSRKILRCTILGTQRHGECVQLPRMPLESPVSESGVPFTRHHFPVKLAFAMTINKAQGQSVFIVGLMLWRARKGKKGGKEEKWRTID